MKSHYAYPQSCSLGPLPPRTPARPDPQVPREPKLGAAQWGMIGAFYVYVGGSRDDPAFGMFAIEISLQRLSNQRARVEIYAIADGYQRGGALGSQHPLTTSLKHGDRVAASFVWLFPNIVDGVADPMSFSRDIDLAQDAGVDRIELALAGD